MTAAQQELGPSEHGTQSSTGRQSPTVAANGLRISPKKGVFLLPWRGAVGQTACAAEIEAVALEADKWGPGQVIVLEIDSPGGLLTEVFKVIDTIAKVRERHRIVAWVREAISGAAVSAMVCDEIYFRKDGALGAAMMIRGADSPYGSALETFRDEIGAVIEKNGRPRAVFEAMVLAKPVLTYTKDPTSGKATFHDRITGLPGEVVLSDEKDSLVFNAENALACGFSKGTASSGEELAPLLGLKEWHEVSDFGVKLASASRMVFEACEQDFKQLQVILAGSPADGSPAGLRAQALALEKVLAWNTICPPCIAGRIGDTGVEQVRRALADLRPKLVEPARAGD